MIKIKTIAAILLTTLVLSACAQTTNSEVGPATITPAYPTETRIPTIAIVFTETPVPTDKPAPSASPVPPTPTEELPIDWDQAKDFVGRVKTVCGLVRGTFFAESSNRQPTFLNIGKEYPDPERFTVIIWGEDRKSFLIPPEQAYLNQTICVTGEIQKFEGIVEIIVEDQSQITLP